MDEEWRRDTERRKREAIDAVGAPVFGIEPSWTCYRSLGGWGSGSGGHRLHLHHRRDGVWLEVSTSTGERWDDRSALTRWFSVRTMVSELEFPIEVVVDRWERDVAVDGQPVAFVFIGDQQTWIANAVHAGRRIEVDGRGFHPDDFALATVDLRDYVDPADL